MKELNLQGQIDRLNRIGIALTFEHDIQNLLELIVSEARGLAQADGGSLYLVEEKRLRFEVAQNGTLEKRLGDQEQVEHEFQKSYVDITKQSLAGYVALTGDILNINDAYQIPEEKEYHFSSAFDEQNDYRTKSMILVPMRDRKDRVAGVLCLINALDESGEYVPFSAEMERLLSSVGSQAMAAIDNARLIRQLKSAHLDTIICLSIAAEQRDTDTGAHVRRISEYSALVCNRMGFNPKDVEVIRYASPLHDVGKIGIPDNILCKPGKLTDEEYEVMKSHTAIGEKILVGDSEYLEAARQICLSHHEKFDGSGYPNGLSGEDIPIFGRIVAVVDVFDALVSERVYKKAFGPKDALEIVKKDTSTHFCPEVSNVFVNCFDEMLATRDRLIECPHERDFLSPAQLS